MSSLHTLPRLLPPASTKYCMVNTNHVLTHLPFPSVFISCSSLFPFRPSSTSPSHPPLPQLVTSTSPAPSLPYTRFSDSPAPFPTPLYSSPFFPGDEFKVHLHSSLPRSHPIPRSLPPPSFSNPPTTSIFQPTLSPCPSPFSPTSFPPSPTPSPLLPHTLHTEGSY